LKTTKILCMDIFNEYTKSLDENNQKEIERLFNHIKTIYEIINYKYDKLSYLLLEVCNLNHKYFFILFF